MTNEGSGRRVVPRTALIGWAQALLDARVTLAGWTLTNVTDISSDGTWWASARTTTASFRPFAAT